MDGMGALNGTGYQTLDRVPGAQPSGPACAMAGQGPSRERPFDILCRIHGRMLIRRCGPGNRVKS
jgi:hypothetical protein